MSVFFINLDKKFSKRFDMGKFIKFENDNFDPLTSNFFNKIRTLPQDSTFKITTEMGRPDQISRKIYGDEQYWWIILLYNNIFDVEQLVSGLELGYPDSDALDEFYFTLKQSSI